MRKLTLSISCIIAFTHTIDALHIAEHENAQDIPTAHAGKYKPSEFSSEPPMQAVAEYSHTYTQAQGKAIPATDNAIIIDTNSSTILHPENITKSIDLNHSENNTTVQAVPIDENEPITIYNAQGRIVSQHFLNDDGSEHHTLFNDDKSTTTTILDANKVKQQVTIKNPDNSSITKHYNEQGQLVATETTHADGTKINLFNNLEGDITQSEIRNKTDQLESTMQLDDYGNRMITTYHADGKQTQSYQQVPQTFSGPDGTTITVTYNADGSSETKQINSDGKTIAVAMSNHHGYDDITRYDSATGNVISYETVTNKNDIETRILYDADKITLKAKTITDKDGQEITQYNSDGSEETTRKNQLDQITQYEKINKDGSENHITYDPKTGDIEKEITITIDPVTGNKKSQTRDKNKHLELEGFLTPDGSGQAIHYNSQGKAILKEIFHADGTRSMVPLA